MKALTQSCNVTTSSQWVSTQDHITWERISHMGTT